MMADDDNKPPVRLYEQRLRFTPNGTQFSNELTKEGRERLAELERAKAGRAPSEIRQNSIRKAFMEKARMNSTEITNSKGTTRKGRDDFER